jgi:hypothetical protein
MTRSQFLKRSSFVATLALLLGLSTTSFAFFFTPTAGGNGGEPWEDFCSTADGTFLQAVVVRSGSWIDNIQGKCDNNGNLSDHGGGGGTTTQPQSCPEGFAIVGLVGRYGSYVNELSILCVNLSNQMQQWQWPTPSGGTNAPSAYSISCFEQDGEFEAASGLAGRSGIYIDQIGLICSNV